MTEEQKKKDFYSSSITLGYECCIELLYSLFVAFFALGAKESPRVVLVGGRFDINQGQQAALPFPHVFGLINTWGNCNDLSAWFRKELLMQRTSELQES